MLLNPPKILPKKSNMNRGKNAFKPGTIFIKAGSSTNNLFFITALIIFFASLSGVSMGMKIGSLTPSNIPVFTKAGQTAVIPIWSYFSFLNSIYKDSVKEYTAALLEA